MITISTLNAQIPPAPRKRAGGAASFDAVKSGIRAGVAKILRGGLASGVGSLFNPDNLDPYIWAIFTPREAAALAYYGGGDAAYITPRAFATATGQAQPPLWDDDLGWF